MTPWARYSFFSTTVLAAVVASSLGVWQLRRLAERRARNRSALAERDRPPVDLSQETLPESVFYRSVRATGVFDFDHQVVLRGRLLRGTPGVQVITPFRPTGRDTAVMVNRGFVPTADAGPPPGGDLHSEPERTSIHGVALAMPDEGDGHPITTANGESWRRLDRSALARRLPYPIAGYYLIMALEPEDGSAHAERGNVLPIRIEPPPLDDGPHLSYAVQWFMIAAAALGFGVVFVLQGGRGRH